MFRRVRDAARKGGSQAKSLLKTVGHAAAKVGLWLVSGTIVAAKKIKLGAKYLARGVTWTWMTALEIYAMSDAPFLWLILNPVFYIIRVTETAINKIWRKTYAGAHRVFPAFSLQNAWAMMNTLLYPLIALIGWILSPLAGKAWWKETSAQYKYRTIHLADYEYEIRITRDLGWDVFKDTSIEEAYHRQFKDATLESEAAYMIDELGLTLVEPDPNTGRTDYAWEQIYAYHGTEDILVEGRQDYFGRVWMEVPDDLTLVVPPLVGAPMDARDITDPVEERQPFVTGTTADEPEIIPVEVVEPEPPVAPEEEPELEDVFTEEETVDFTRFAEMSDPKQRSYAFGANYANICVGKIPNYLHDENAQNTARALVFNESKNPQTGLLSHYAVKGFNEQMEKLLRTDDATV